MVMGHVGTNREMSNAYKITVGIYSTKREGKKTNRKTCARLERYSSTENKDPKDTDGGWSGFRWLNLELITSHYEHFFIQ
jgi:hypothetical protein